ncbi:MAG: DUF5716 family protein [Alicyclobacillus sp.]|nr:DUF5716 family protein [Alicyclobacillus sp.]
MQNLFDIVTPNLFSLLSSPNRVSYFRALMVLRECYQRELNFRRSDLATYLMSQMERDLYDWAEEDLLNVPADPAVHPTQSEALADMDLRGTTQTDAPDKLSAIDEALHGGEADAIDFGSLSGRAHALIRRLIETGWLQALTDGSGLDETLIVPQYASILLDAFYSIVEPVQQRYNAFVYNVYSNLRTANDERDEFMFQGLQSAYENTVALRDNLRALLHNIHSYYQNLHQRQEIRELLADHFDSYQLSVAIAAYHPLKTFDSVYRFRPRILEILRTWLTMPSILTQMATSLRQQHSDLDEVAARGDIVQRIAFITDTFESLDDLLKEIDRRHTNYNRASVERIQYLLNTDRDIKGKLVQLLRALPKVQDDSETPLLEAMRNLPIYQVRYLDPQALYTAPTRRKRGKPQPVLRHNTADDAAFRAEARELMERMNALYSQQRIAEFILKQMNRDGTVVSSDLTLQEFDDFLRVMVAVVRGDEPEMPYDIIWDEEKASVVVHGYRIPLMTFVRKEVE